MKRHTGHNPTRELQQQANFTSLYLQISHDWQHKAAALRARRWQALTSK